MHAPAPTLSLNLLGCPELRCGDQPLKLSGMGLRLLAILALGGPTPRLKLADLLWDAPTHRALHNLRMALYQLRRALGEHSGILQEKQNHLSLDLTRLHIDALHMDARHIDARQDPAPATQEFMSGHRTGGSESWLEWAQEQEERLKHQPNTSLPSAPVSQVWQPFTFQLPDDRPNDLAQQAQHALHLGDTITAERAARETLLKHTKGNSAALALNVLAYLVMNQGEYQRAYQYAKKAVQSQPEPEADYAYTQAYLSGLLGVPERGIPIVQDRLRQLPAQTSPARLYALLGNLHNAQSQFRAARHWHELSLQAAYAADDPIVLTRALTFMLWNLNATGEHARAEHLAHEGLEYGWQPDRMYLMNSLGIAQLHLGKLGQALETFTRQMNVPNVTLAATAHSYAALTLHLMNEPEAAYQHLLSGLELCHCTENGRVQYEWAVTALQLNPGLWLSEAQTITHGRYSTDPLIVQKYRAVLQKVTAHNTETPFPVVSLLH